MLMGGSGLAAVAAEGLAERIWAAGRARGSSPCRSLYSTCGGRLLQCVQAVVSVGREDCRGAARTLLEVLVTVLAPWGPTGPPATKVRGGASCFGAAPGL